MSVNHHKSMAFCPIIAPIIGAIISHRPYSEFLYSIWKGEQGTYRIPPFPMGGMGDERKGGEGRVEEG
jgi:hypothetical protein